MAINFPDSPSIGDEFTGGGFSWTWSGASWDKQAASSAAAETFTLNVGTSGNKTYTFGTDRGTGTYTITSLLGDNTYDVYFVTSSNENAGYSNTGSIEATAAFNRVVVYGATTNDVLTFTYNLAASPSSDGDVQDGAAPFLSAATPTTLESADDSTTVVGGNFATDVEITFVGQDATDRPAKSVVRSSSTELIVTRPDDFPVTHEPYSMIATNVGITNPSTNANKLTNYFDAGGGITWSTSSTLPEFVPTSAYSTTLSATDADGQAVTYSVTAGTLPDGLSLNSSTGEISGTPTTGALTTFTVTATDSGNNTSQREFYLNSTLIEASGGSVSTVGNYRYHTFTGSNTFTVTNNPLNTALDYLIVAGGGGSQAYNSGSGDASSGGGGAGGYLASTFVPSATSYAITVGAGGNGAQGTSSSAFSITATGGGYGGGGGNGAGNGNGGGNGGSGGGTGTYAGGNTGGTGIAGQGNNGGYSGGRGNGGGGGGAGEAATGGPGGDGLQWLNGSYYAGGGGGGGNSQPGGLGGGGNGASNISTGGQVNYGGNGGTNTGGGSGGNDSAFANTPSRTGGSGIVIVRYPLS